MAYKEIEDFGFSSFSIDEIGESSDLEAQIVDLTEQVEREQKRTLDLFNRMNVFIANLSAAEKDYIFWPVEERRTKLEQFRAELEGIVQEE